VLLKKKTSLILKAGMTKSKTKVKLTTDNFPIMKKGCCDIFKSPHRPRGISNLWREMKFKLPAWKPDTILKE
jgi:hypothetical protein